MSPVVRVIASVIQVALVVGGGPLLLGVMAKVRARAEGRVGAPVTQPWRDLVQQLRKRPVRPDTASPVFAVVPVVVVALTAAASAISPLVTTAPALSSGSDLLVVVFLLLAGSVALALGGLDPGTAFGGMGASRALTIGALAEPALLVSVAALSIQAGTSNLPRLVGRGLAHPVQLASPAHALALAALVVVVVAETGRLPVDNPATHLELTMVHEAQVLEYSGPDLALANLGTAMRLGLLFGLIVTLLAPFGVATRDDAGALALGALALVAKALVLALGVALVEVRSAKLRLFRVPELLAGSFILAVLAVVASLVVR